MDEGSLVEYGARRVIITITAVTCALLQIIDTTIVNIALPTMQGALGASLSEITWVITAYAIANVVVMPMTSWLSQQFGRRNYFAGSIIIFTVFSLLCGNATTITELIVFRFLQGIGGGALLVTAQTIITESYPVEKRAMAQTIYVLGVIVGPTLGPPLGGYIVDNYSWPFIFYINIPIGLFATLLTIQYIKSPRYAEKVSGKYVDWLGIALLTIAVGHLQFILEKGQEEDWFNSPLISISAAISFFGFFFFIWREMVYEYPVVDLSVLKDVNLSVGSILSFVLGFGLFGSTFVIPLYTQTIMGWTAFQAGMLMIPSTIFTAIMMPFVGKMMEKGVSFRLMITSGMVIFFIYSLMAYRVLTPNTGEDAFFWILVIRGIGLGLLSVPVTTMALSTLHGPQISQGAALSGMLRQLGGSFGVAIITTYLTRDVQFHRVDLIGNLSAYDPEVQQRINLIAQNFQSKGMAWDVAQKAALQLEDNIVNIQATVLSYMDIFLWIGVMFLVCVPFVLILVKKSKNKIHASEMIHE